MRRITVLWALDGRDESSRTSSLTRLPTDLFGTLFLSSHANMTIKRLYRQGVAGYDLNGGSYEGKLVLWAIQNVCPS
jgi:hypothetical protein